ncbi:MAG: hypothetical protein ABIP28_03400 [Mucilaginibacter sp.]
MVWLGSLSSAYAVEDMSKGDLHGFMAFFYYFGVLYFFVALLTQWIIIVPVWQTITHKSLTAKLITTIIIVFICGIVAAGIASIITDPVNEPGKINGRFMLISTIQLAYWAMDFFILYLVTGKVKKDEIVPDETEG